MLGLVLLLWGLALTDVVRRRRRSGWHEWSDDWSSQHGDHRPLT